jgi:hypothetical protein
MDSWRMERRRAVVGVARESPTPTEESTAREERRLAMLEEKAWRESCC